MIATTLLLFTSWLKAWLFVSDYSSSSSSDSSGFSTGGIIAVVIFAVIFKITCLGLCIWRWTIRLRYRRSVSLRGWEWDDNSAYPYKFVRQYSTEEPSFQWHVNNIPTIHFTLEFSEILSQNPTCYDWPSVCGNSIIMHCGILIKVSWVSDEARWVGHKLRLFMPT